MELPHAARRSIRKDRHIATVMVGIRNTHARLPEQKGAVSRPTPARTLDRGSLDGLHDRAMLLLGWRLAPCGDGRARLPRGSDRGRPDWIVTLDKGILLELEGKTRWRAHAFKSRQARDHAAPVPQEVRIVAESANFRSREASTKSDKAVVPRPALRRRGTGRNVQFNI
ncbi:hypothetical protein [Arvimicrobium flavum]|uniref:hypothetical protein n=1 Tax=Arvimicrobium flavum TaxID=3393320 RepID=UPI00398CBCEE